MLEWTLSSAKAYKEIFSAVDAVVHNGVAYFRGHRKQYVLSYNFATEKWDKLPICVVEDTTLVIVNDTLTTVGGVNTEPALMNAQGVLTSDLFSYDLKEWRKVLPSMATKRSQVTAISIEEVLIVAGGRGDSGALATVEVLNLNNKQWSFAGNLPEALYRASVCICRGYLYVLGGESVSTTFKYAFRASVSDFCDPRRQSGDIFSELAELPLENTACISVRGKILAIGGSASSKASKLVYMYDSQSNVWRELKSSMIVPRCNCFAVALSDSKLMVVGGCIYQPTVSRTDSIEFADLKV